MAGAGIFSLAPAPAKKSDSGRLRLHNTAHCLKYILFSQLMWMVFPAAADELLECLHHPHCQPSNHVRRTRINRSGTTALAQITLT